MILSGKPVNAKKALRMGLIDEILPKSDLKNILRVDPVRKSFKVENSALSKRIVEYVAGENLLKKTGGNYPAQEVALKVVVNSIGVPMYEANVDEAKEFGKLAVSNVCKNLIGLYFSSESLKKQRVSTETVKIKNVAVLGAGVMGAGIAWLTNHNGYSTTLKDLNYNALTSGLVSIDKIYKQLKRIRKIDSHNIEMKMHGISTQVDYTGFEHADLVVEAIVERMDIKQQQFEELEKHVSKDCIIATNTSTLDVDEMSKDLKHRDRFVGLHFFNPVNRMPLVEIIVGEETSDKTIQAMIDLCKKTNKIPVIVKNSPGFLVNRILMPYLNEACMMYDQGVSIEYIDKAFVNHGFPMGPFMLMDTIGLDVCSHVAESLKPFYGDRIQTSDVYQTMVELGWKGKKSGKGFYIHGKKTVVNPEIEKSQAISKSLIVTRGISAMRAEAHMCMEEGIVSDISHLNTALVYGIGYPPFRGGLLG
jgi:3-hydroxyacyl-CoA dehydrogenase/enoyl-CoA hydratase/3-hydroxybutyryl-CoA epimerase